MIVSSDGVEQLCIGLSAVGAVDLDDIVVQHAARALPMRRLLATIQMAERRDLDQRFLEAPPPCGPYDSQQGTDPGVVQQLTGCFNPLLDLRKALAQLAQLASLTL